VDHAVPDALSAQGGVMRGAPSVWLLLVAATLVSWFVSDQAPSARLSSTAIVLIAGCKINLVVARFMELGWQPRPFRLIVSAWLAIVMVILIGGYWLV
jgi:cytochrome c oxidase subunit IV